MTILNQPSIFPETGEVWEFCGWNEPHHAWLKVVIKGVWLMMEHGTGNQWWEVEYLTLEGLRCQEDSDKFMARYRYLEDE